MRSEALARKLLRLKIVYTYKAMMSFGGGRQLKFGSCRGQAVCNGDGAGVEDWATERETGRMYGITPDS
jgi:hypothetical protein